MTSVKNAIHAGFRQLGIVDDDDKRAIYVRVTGQPRLSLMTSPEEEAVLTELRRLGFRSFERRANGQPKLTGKYAKKLQAMWIAAWNLGVVPSRDDAGLIGFVKRQTNIDSVRFVHHWDDASAVIEALKARMARDAGVDWSNAGLPARSPMRSHGYKIARAQWRILYPAKEMQTETYFWIVVTDLIDLDETTRVLTDKQWIEVMNYLGQQVRALKKKAAL